MNEDLIVKQLDPFVGLPNTPLERANVVATLDNIRQEIEKTMALPVSMLEGPPESLSSAMMEGLIERHLGELKERNCIVDSKVTGPATTYNITSVDWSWNNSWRGRWVLYAYCTDGKVRQYTGPTGLRKIRKMARALLNGGPYMELPIMIKPVKPIEYISLRTVITNRGGISFDSLRNST